MVLGTQLIGFLFKKLLRALDAWSLKLETSAWGLALGAWRPDLHEG